MENQLINDTEHFQVACTERHIVASITWGKMVATCTFCNMIKTEIENLNFIINSLKAENLEPSVCFNTPVELSHSTHTVHVDGVNQEEAAYCCASFQETKPYPEKCISSDEIENVDSHVTKEAEVFEMNVPPKNTDNLLTIKVEHTPEMLHSTEVPVDRESPYNNVNNTERPVGMEGSYNQYSHTRAAQGGEGSGCPTGAAQGGEGSGSPTGAAQGGEGSDCFSETAQVGVDSGCACCRDIKASINIYYTDGYRNIEAKNMESNTMKKLSKCAKAGMGENRCKMTSQAQKGDFDSNESFSLEIPSELDCIGLEELVVSNLESSVTTNESTSLQSELPQKASQLTLYDQTELVHNEPGDMNGQQNNIDEDRQYLCEICAKRFSTLDGLSMHHVIHRIEKSNGEVIGFGESVNEVVSKEQHKRFAKKRLPNLTLNEAMSDVCQVGNNKEVSKLVTVKTSYQCKVCGKIFVGKSSLAEHKKKHTGGKRYKCEVCGKDFSRKGNVKSHMITHTGEKPYKCEVCGKGFTAKQTVTIHGRTHTGEKPYTCNICGKEFAYISHFHVHNRKHKGKKHTMTHTGEKPYKCDTMTHTGEKPYKCEVCGRGFSTKQSLTIHGRTHTGEKPYTCNVCGKEFAFISNFYVHNRKHKGKKPYTCQLCGKIFTHKQSLLKHSMTHKDDQQ